MKKHHRILNSSLTIVSVLQSVISRLPKLIACPLIVLTVVCSILSEVNASVSAGTITSADPDSFVASQGKTVTVRIGVTSGKGNVILECASKPSGWTVSPTTRNPTLAQNEYSNETFTVTPPASGGSGIVVWKLYDDGYGVHPSGSTLLKTYNQSVSATVPKENTRFRWVESDPDSMVKGVAGKLRAKLEKNNSPYYNDLQGKTVKFYVNNVYKGSDTTDNQGEAEINYTPSSTSSFTLKAVFNGDSAYNATTKSETVSVALPLLSDLVVLDVWTDPASPMEGEEFTIKARVKNNGNTIANPDGLTMPIYVKFWLNGVEPDETGKDGALWVYEIESKEEKVYTSKKYVAPAVNPVEIRAEVDSKDGVTNEVSEVNNTLSKEVSIKPALVRLTPTDPLIITDKNRLPRLNLERCDDLDGDGQIDSGFTGNSSRCFAPGDTIVIGANVENGSLVSAHQVRMTAYFNQSPVLSGKSIIGTIQRTIAAEQTGHLVVEWTAPQSGNYYIYVVIESEFDGEWREVGSQWVDGGVSEDPIIVSDARPIILIHGWGGGGFRIWES